MGFMSWDCLGCGHSIRHVGATKKTSGWMAYAIVLARNGDRVSGIYDGYGNIAGFDLGEVNVDFALYHQACWTILGRPKYTKSSASAHDQGHFVGEYDPAQPKTKKDLYRLKSEKEKR